MILLPLSPVAEITGMLHHIWPELFLKLQPWNPDSESTPGGTQPKTTCSAMLRILKYGRVLLNDRDCSEKCIIRQFHGVDIIEGGVYTNLDGTAY